MIPCGFEHHHPSRGRIRRPRCRPWHQGRCYPVAVSTSVSISLFQGRVVENISKRCGGFLRQLSLRGCLSVGDASMKWASSCLSGIGSAVFCFTMLVWLLAKLIFSMCNHVALCLFSLRGESLCWGIFSQIYSILLCCVHICLLTVALLKDFNKLLIRD